MGREIRKVPKNWEHPKNENGKYKPLMDEFYGDAIKEWIENHNLWLEGEHPDQQDETFKDSGLEKYRFYAEWDGDCPEVDTYRKEDWTEKDACCFQMYENVSEGTPVSPIFSTLLELEDWLVTNQGHSRQAAHNFCESGYAPSFTMMNGVFKNGVDSCE